MILAAIPHLHVQKREFSDLALSTELAETLSEEMINRIRLIAMNLFTQIADRSLLLEENRYQISLSTDQVKDTLEKTILTIRDRSVLYKRRKNLFERAVAEFTAHYKDRTTIRSPKEDFEKIETFSDRCLSSWANLAQARFIVASENERGTPSVEVPMEIRTISCYRYALSEAGIDVKEVLTEKNFSQSFQD